MRKTLGTLLLIASTHLQAAEYYECLGDSIDQGSLVLKTLTEESGNLLFIKDNRLLLHTRVHLFYNSSHNLNIGIRKNQISETTYRISGTLKKENAFFELDIFGMDGTLNETLDNFTCYRRVVFAGN